MKVKKNKKKVLKRIDLERTLTKFYIVGNTSLLILAVVNGVLWKNERISSFVIGWCVCALMSTTVTSIVSHNNFKYEMDNIARKYLDARWNSGIWEVDEDGEKKKNRNARNNK